MLVTCAKTAAATLSPTSKVPLLLAMSRNVTTFLLAMALEGAVVEFYMSWLICFREGTPLDSSKRTTAIKSVRILGYFQFLVSAWCVAWREIGSVALISG